MKSSLALRRVPIDEVGHVDSLWNQSRGGSSSHSIKIQDFTTDIEELPGIVSRNRGLPKIADLLIELGVDSIAVRAGFGSDSYIPSEKSLETSKKIASSHTGRVFAVCGPTKQDVDRVVAIGTNKVTVQTSTSELAMKYILKTKVDELIERIVGAIDYAKSHGLSISYMASDSTRSSKATIAKIARVSEKAGCEMFVLADSTGCATPTGIYKFVRFMKRVTNLPIAVHCHNDYGLATANAIAGADAGAKFLQTCVLGLGERAGLAALEEVAVASEFLLGAKTGIDLSALTSTCRAISEIVNLPLTLKKPICGVGSMGFQGERLSELLDRLEASNARLLAMPYLPELVGNETHRFLTDEVDQRSLKYRLRRLNKKTSAKLLERMSRECAMLAEGQHAELSDSQLLNIYDRVSDEIV